MRFAAVVLAVAVALIAVVDDARAVEVRAAVLRVDYPTLPPISRYDDMPEDLGFAGAVLATEDNSTTGGFLGHTYGTETGNGGAR